MATDIPTPPRPDSPSAVLAGYQDLTGIAQRIIKRTMLGNTEVAAELIMRELSTHRPDRAFGLALALGEECLDAAADSRASARDTGVRWLAAMHDPTLGADVTVDSEHHNATWYAMAILDAIHRHRETTDAHAVRDLGVIYEDALHGDPELLFGMYDRLVQYAVAAQRGDLRVATD